MTTMTHLPPVFRLAQDHHTEIPGVVAPQEQPVRIINDEGTQMRSADCF